MSLTLQLNSDGETVTWGVAVGGDHYLYLNYDPVSQPVEPSNLSGVSGDFGTLDQYGFGTGVMAAPGTVDVWVYVENLDGSDAIRLGVALYMNGGWLTEQNQSIAAAAKGWKQYTFTGSWNQTDLDAMQVAIQQNDPGEAGLFVRRLYAVVSPAEAPAALAVEVTAAADPVTGTTLDLSAAASDGTGPYAYAWSCTASPAGSEPAFDDDAIAEPTVIFDQAGDYTFRCDVSDAAEGADYDTVSVTVAQTATAVTISPVAAVMWVGGTVQFAAAVADQFADAIDAASIIWAVDSGVGEISVGGLYTGSEAGVAVVSAASGLVSAVAGVAVRTAAELHGRLDRTRRVEMDGTLRDV